jgi:hypothetical protein
MRRIFYIIILLSLQLIYAQSKEEQSKEEQSKEEQSKEEQSKEEQSKEEQSKVEQSKVDKNLIKNDETNALVPALDNFHKIIVSIFHDYIPKKDFEAMKNALPTIENDVEEICKSKLPEILSEKQNKWDIAKDTLKIIVAEYTDAAMYSDDDKLLIAAKRIHIQYEKMMRLIKPKAKNLDSLHILMHEIKNKLNISENSEELKKMIPLINLRKDSVMAIHFKYRGRADNIELKQKSEAKIEAFEKMRLELEKEINNFINLLSSKDMENIRKSFEMMHNKYHLCESTLD